MSLASVLAADDGQCVAAVGAGGKKTTLYRLGRLLDRAVVTSTVRIPIFDDHVEDVVVTADPVSTLRSRSDEGEVWPLGLVPEREREDRYRGYAPHTVDGIVTAHDGPVLVKADGARNRLFKAPDGREPQFPSHVDTALPLVSARVVGKPLSDEWVHQPELVSDLAGVAVGDALDATAVARVLASPAGGLKGVPAGVTVVAVVNMVDDDALRAVGGRVAAETLSLTDRIDRVVLTQLVAPDPVVEVFA